MMRILYLDLTPGIGGSLISLEQLLQGLDRRVFEPLVLLPAHSPMVARLEAQGIRVVTVPTFIVEAARSSSLVGLVKGTPVGQRLRDGGCLGRLWAWARGVRNTVTRTLPLTWRLYRAIQITRPALVHVNDAVFVSRPAIAAAWLARTPVVCHVRSLGPFQAWDRLWAKTVRRFIFISQWVADDQARQGIAAARGQRIYNGINLTLYREGMSRADARRQLNLPADRPIVAVIGRLVPWKGQDLFVQALQYVRATVPDIVGLIVGETEGYSQEFGHTLQEQVLALGLSDTVRFLGHSEEIPAILAAIDVLAHTSVTPEPFGRVLAEAMAAGRPVITPAEGGGTEIVINGETGLWFRPRDPRALADAITALLTDWPRAQAMAAAGQRRAAALFSCDRLVAEVSTFYLDLFDGTPRPA